MAKYGALRERELLPIGFPHIMEHFSHAAKNVRLVYANAYMRLYVCSVRGLNIIQKTHQNTVLRKNNHEYEVN